MAGVCTPFTRLLPGGADARECRILCGHLQARLREVTRRVDASFLDNTELTLDAAGKPHLKRLNSPAYFPKNSKPLKPYLKSVCRSANCLDILKNVHHEIDVHNGTLVRLQGPNTNLTDPFRATCLLSSAMPLSSGPRKLLAIPKTSWLAHLRRLNAQHITTDKLAAALRDVINEYTRGPNCRFCGAVGSGDCRWYACGLIENNLLALVMSLWPIWRHCLPPYQRYVYRSV